MRYKIGIIGYGVGEHHFKAYQNNAYCEVKSVCDFSLSKLKKLKHRYPNLYITKKDHELIVDKDIDIISIASYDNFHFQQLIDSIKNEKNVFVEKPMATDPKWHTLCLTI